MQAAQNITYLDKQSINAPRNIAIVYQGKHISPLIHALISGIKPNQANYQQIAIDHLNGINWYALEHADAIIFGCPWQYGGMSPEFIRFMQASHSLQQKRTWQDKLAAGFCYPLNGQATNGFENKDYESQQVLNKLCLFASQHSMHWISLGYLANEYQRLGQQSIGLNCQNVFDNSNKELKESELHLASLFSQRIIQSFGSFEQLAQG